ncbi:MAG: hypothetical protein M1829_004718 [Trizodia sp. TS-e1964]|nr:MAG: hypothetical protein M1829_004718 [Trizodia sp. TS-e1964]
MIGYIPGLHVEPSYLPLKSRPANHGRSSSQYDAGVLTRVAQIMDGARTARSIIINRGLIADHNNFPFWLLLSFGADSQKMRVPTTGFYLVSVNLGAAAPSFDASLITLALEFLQSVDDIKEGIAGVALTKELHVLDIASSNCSPLTVEGLITDKVDYNAAARDARINTDGSKPLGPLIYQTFIEELSKNTNFVKFSQS